MCGITGKIVEKKEDIDLAIEGVNSILHRGTDAYGAMIIACDKKEVKLTKGLAKDHLDIIAKMTKEMLDKHEKVLLIIHNRKASIGKATDIDLAHPVWYPEEKWQWAVIQNGTKRSLADIVDAKSDTAAIAKILTLLREPEDITEFITGAGVVIATNPTGDVFFWHDESRTLFYSKELKMFISEPMWNKASDWQYIDHVTFYRSGEEFMATLEENLVPIEEVIVEAPSWQIKDELSNFIRKGETESKNTAKTQTPSSSSARRTINLASFDEDDWFNVAYEASTTSTTSYGTYYYSSSSLYKIDISKDDISKVLEYAEKERLTVKTSDFSITQKKVTIRLSR